MGGPGVGAGQITSSTSSSSVVSRRSSWMRSSHLVVCMKPRSHIQVPVSKLSLTYSLLDPGSLVLMKSCEHISYLAGCVFSVLGVVRVIRHVELFFATDQIHDFH